MHNTSSLSPSLSSPLPPFLSPVSLVGLEGGSNVTRLGRFANYLRGILPHADVTLTEMTARAIGQLALAEGTYTAEYVEFEVKRALEWITGAENKKLAAVSRLWHRWLWILSLLHPLLFLPFPALSLSLPSFASHSFIDSSLFSSSFQLISSQVLILRELAIHTPTLFYQQIQQFFDNIFVAVRDPKVCVVVHASDSAQISVTVG